MYDLFGEDQAYAVFQRMGEDIGGAVWLNAVERIVADTPEKLRAMVSDLLQGLFVTYDVEATGLNIIDDRLVALQFCARPDRAYFVPIAMMGMQNVSIAEVVVICAPLWARGLIGHNIGFDWQFMQRWVDVQIEADTLLEAKLVPELWEEFQHDWRLKNLGQKLFKRSTIDFKDLFPRGTKKSAMRFDCVPPELAVPYACQDVVLTWLLHQYLIEQRGLDQQSFIYGLEHEIIKPFARMELLGIGLDVEQVERARTEAQVLMAQDMALIEGLAGKPLNLNATKDVAWLLYEQCGLPILGRTGGGQPSTDKATLEKLAGKHEVVDTLLRYRATAKLEQAFLKPLPEMVASDGCIHTSYKQYGAITGRASSSSPNLQQVPKERGRDADEFRRAIRSAFRPPPGFIGLLDADFKAIEYRLLASLANETALMEGIRRGVDVHQQTAALMFGLPVEQVDKHLRGRGKTINFASVYGQTESALSDSLGMSRRDVRALLAIYWKALPNVQRYLEQLKQDARDTGYATTYFGRRRYLPHINSDVEWQRSQAERYATNAPIQGLAADVMKLAIARTAIALERDFKSRMVLTVHDQLTVAIHPDDRLDDVAEALREAMEIELPGFVPLETDPGYGVNWNDVESYVYPSRRGPAPAPGVALLPLPAAALDAVPAVEASPPAVDADAPPTAADVALDAGPTGGDVPVDESVAESPDQPAPDATAGSAHPDDPSPPGPAGDGIPLTDVPATPEHFLRVTIPSDMARERVQMVRSLFTVRGGDVPVILVVEGQDTATPFHVTVDQRMLLDLRRLGFPFALGEGTKAAFRQQFMVVA